jgi:DNA-binding SARP family transcriptional activator
MLSVNLLGSPEVSIDGTPIVVDTRKAIALLAYLVVEKSATRDTLAGLLWADSSQERARATLRRTLSALRGATGSGLLEADRSMVSMVGDITSDLEMLALELDATTAHDHDPHDVCSQCIPHLRRATDLYRGDFLQGFSLRASPEFDDWERTVTESIRLRVGGAFNRLGTALAAEGDYPAAVAVVTKWLDLDQLHEPAHRFLMLLNAWAGNRPGAIEAYRNCVAILDQELGVPPLDETIELYEAILDEDLPPAPGTRRRIRAQSPPPTHTQSDLIDREVELQILRGAVRSLSIRGHLIAMTGASWMGKTRILEEMAAEAAAHHPVIGRAFRMEQTLPYGVATQILRAALPRIEAHLAEIPGWALAEVGRLLPELGTDSTQGTADRFGELRLLEGVHTVVSTLAATQPLIVILDDAQWVDPASAGVFSYLARRITAMPMLLIVAARSGDELLPAMADVIGSADQVIALGPLTTEHLIPLAGDEATAARLQKQTGGVPLLVVEALSSEGAHPVETPGVLLYMESRLREVGDLGRQILTAAAVLNGICDAALLRETSGRSDEEVVEAVEELVGAGLLREMPESDGLSFTLDALEKVAYDSTSLIRRRLLHRRAAQALAERSHSRADPRLAAAVAGQYQAAGDPEAAGWYHLAGDLARAVYAHDSARHFYETSLALDNAAVAQVRLALGELAMTAGEYDQARRELTTAASHAGHESIGMIEHRMGEVERLLGRFNIAEEHFARAIEDHPEPAAVLSDWALLAHRIGDTKKATQLADKARMAAEQLGDVRQLSRVHNILGVVTSDKDDAVGHVEEAIRLAGDDDMLRMAALNNRALLVAENGSRDEAVELVEEAIAIAVRTGHRHREAALWNHLADLHHRAGRESAAQDALTKAVSLFADIDAGDMEPELWLLARW